LAEALGRAGRWPVGLEVLQDAWALTLQGGERWHEAELHRIRAGLLAMGNDSNRQLVQGSLEKAAAVAVSQGAQSWLARAQADAQRLLGQSISLV
jgi:predicted ATPase